MTTRILLFVGIFIGGLSLGHSVAAHNPHHRLKVAMETQVRQVSLGQDLLSQTRELRDRRPLLFFCLDLSCQEEFIYGQYQDLYSINGHFASSPNAYLGWLVFESLKRSQLDKKMRDRHGVNAPSVLERELLIAFESGRYLVALERELGPLDRSDDYYYNDRFEYAAKRGFGLLLLRAAYRQGERGLETYVLEREVVTASKFLRVDTYLQTDVSQAQKEAARDIRDRYRQMIKAEQAPYRALVPHREKREERY